MKQKKNIFCVLGRSATGKDTLVMKVCEDLDMKSICSYTTRPKRTANDTSHLFITEEEAASKVNIIAKTEINGYKYFVTKDQLDEMNFYIIDPKGLQDLRSNEELCEEYNFVAVYVWIPEEIRQRRIRMRGDNLTVAESRTKSEDKMFRAFEASQGWDYSICNIDLEAAITKLKNIVKENTYEETLSGGITKPLSNF